MDQATLLWSTLFGGMGIGYIMYGKKQKKKVALICCLSLIVFPYLVTGTLLIVGIGTLLLVMPWVVRQ